MAECTPEGLQVLFLQKLRQFPHISILREAQAWALHCRSAAKYHFLKASELQQSSTEDRLSSCCRLWGTTCCLPECAWVALQWGDPRALQVVTRS